MPLKRPLPAAIWASNTAPALRAEAQVDMADDAGAGAQVAVEARRAHRRHAVGELGLAGAAQLGRTFLAVHRMAVDEHGADDVVAGPGCRPAGRGTCSRCRRAATDDGADRRSAARARAPAPASWRPTRDRASMHVAELSALSLAMVSSVDLYRDTAARRSSRHGRATTFQPTSGKRTQVCVCRPVVSGRAPCRPGSPWRCRGPA